MKKLIVLLHAILFALNANALSAISGTFTLCAGSVTYLTDATTGGTWASSNTAVATIGSTGVVFGASAGVSTITYTVGTSYVTVPVVVNPMPAPITGFGHFCTGSTSTLSDAVSGGSWTSDDPTVATVVSTSGVVGGVVPGFALMIYTLPGGCYVFAYDTIIDAIGPITGAPSTCVGYTDDQSDDVSGGTWVSSNTAVATIGLTSGVVTGVALGTTIISYSATSSCGSETRTTTVSVASPLTAGAITGSTSTLYIYDREELRDGVYGVWTSSAILVATVGSTTGTVVGEEAGTSTISYTVMACTGPVYTTTVITVLSTIAPIVGPATVCLENEVTYTQAHYDSIGGPGAWSSSNTAVGTINSLSGEFTPVSLGTTTLAFTLLGYTTTAVVTVLASPAPVSGTDSICLGATTTFIDATPGGTWVSEEDWIATVGSLTGLVTGVSDGDDDIYYVLPDGCKSGYDVAINTFSPTIPEGSGFLCGGSTDSLTDSVTGGNWISADPAVATVGATSGVVTGVSAGTVIISYGFTGACGVHYSMKTVTVSTTTDPGIISGSDTGYMDITTYLYETATGVWASSNIAAATIGSGSGVVTGVSVGTTIISFAVNGCGGIVYTLDTVTIDTTNEISGYVVFSEAYWGPVKVWLIAYDPTTLLLEAVDSDSVYCAGDSVFYRFLGMGTDSFRVKANIGVDTISASYYIPSYHTSSFYWHDASVVYHAEGTINQYQDIIMQFGVVTSGPGFISGNVMTGANRGTSTSVPVDSLLMVCETMGGTVYQQAYTNSSGVYSFSNLPLGSYRVHPELINYISYDYTNIALTSSSESADAANFIQHTVSHTIAPVGEGVTKVTANMNTVSLYPNPTAGMVQISWHDNATETGTVVITDIAGHQLYVAPLLLTAGSGVSTVDLSDFSGGVYLISIRSANISYNGKVELVR